MYKTINKVFSGKKKSHGSSSSSSRGISSAQESPPVAERPSAGAVERVASQESRPDSPLRMGSPSSASIGETTLRKVVRRIFYGESSLGRKDSGRGVMRGSAEETAGMLAFEVAGVMRRLLEVYDSMGEKILSSLRSNLQAPGVVTLISNDLRVLWGLAGYEKQQELRVQVSRVAVLGRKCRESSLHYLAELFDGLEMPEKDLQRITLSAVEAEILIRFMRDQAEATTNLKTEMEAIQQLHTRIQEYGEWNQLQEMVAQGKLVEKLQSHCLWAYSLDFLVQALVLAVCVVRKKIFSSFGQGTCPQRIKEGSLGEAGLALHYANIVVLLERIIQQPDTVLGPTRDDLYDMLPRNVQYLLRMQLQDPLNFTSDGRVESNLKRGLLLLPTMAHNTIHWHSLHTPGSSLDSSDVVFQVQTFYYADKAAVNAALVDVLLGLCRICGVEAPIGFSAAQLSAGLADYDQLVAKAAQEDEKHFMRQLGTDRRVEYTSGQVYRIEDPASSKSVAEVKETSGGSRRKEGSGGEGKLQGGGGEKKAGKGEKASWKSSSTDAGGRGAAAVSRQGLYQEAAARGREEGWAADSTSAGRGRESEWDLPRVPSDDPLDAPLGHGYHAGEGGGVTQRGPGQKPQKWKDPFAQRSRGSRSRHGEYEGLEEAEEAESLGGRGRSLASPAVGCFTGNNGLNEYTPDWDQHSEVSVQSNTSTSSRRSTRSSRSRKSTRDAYRLMPTN